MIKISNISISNWENAIRGMRNPLNSWDKNDSYYKDNEFILGKNDFDLCKRLIKAGSEHRKFLRQIFISMDINAPLYWWKEADQYKIGTTTNSCSTMHKIHAKEFTIDDFSHEHLLQNPSLEVLDSVIGALNLARNVYLECKNPITKKDWWWQMIQLLPTSYNQTRTWTGSLENIISMCKQRDNHKLDEWIDFRKICFENIPYLEEFYNEIPK